MVSNVVYWLEKFHIDGLRVDAVSSMLYLDYGRTHYKPNRFGGRENLEAMELLRAVNRAAFSVRPNALMVAEESTSFPMITKPDFDGGTGLPLQMEHGLDERHHPVYADRPHLPEVQTQQFDLLYDLRFFQRTSFSPPVS